MYTVVGTFFALPGKLYELIALLQEAKALGKTINGTDAMIATPVGGMVSEAHYIYRVDSLAQYESEIKNIEANDEYRKLFAKFSPVVVPNTSRWQIYRHL